MWESVLLTAVRIHRKLGKNTTFSARNELCPKEIPLGYHAASFLAKTRYFPLVPLYRLHCIVLAFTGCYGISETS